MESLLVDYQFSAAENLTKHSVRFSIVVFFITGDNAAMSLIKTIEMFTF